MDDNGSCHYCILFLFFFIFIFSFFFFFFLWLSLVTFSVRLKYGGVCECVGWLQYSKMIGSGQPGHARYK